jgi:hypothetical protein
LAGTLASADDNSFCSSAEGAHTLMTFTFTGGWAFAEGWAFAGGCWAEAVAVIARAAIMIRIL